MKNSKLMFLTGLLFLITSPNLAFAQNVKIGLLGGVSGPIAAMAPAMIDGAMLAVKQVNNQGGLFSNNSQLEAVVGDSGCNPQNSTDSATKLINIENVVGIVGPHCSGATIAAAESVAIPAGVAIISPSATAPTVSALKDNNLVFRTVPSDAYQGQVLARTILAKGHDNVAVAYLNNDYGSGLANSFSQEFEASGGTIAIFQAHEEGKASYRAELASLASSGADTLVIFDYGDGSGLTILRQALENDFFSTYFGGDGMKSGAIIENLGSENLNNFYASAPVGTEGASLQAFNLAFENEGGDPNAIFVTTSYDAAFILALAIEKAASSNRLDIAKAIPEVAKAPGTKIYAGQWKKAKQAIANGQDIDYVGATGNLEFDQNGDVPGSYSLFKVVADNFEVDIKIMK